MSSPTSPPRAHPGAPALTDVGPGSAARRTARRSAYAVFTGTGATGTVLLGMLFLGDGATPTRLLPIAPIVAGVIWLRVLDG